MRKSKLWHIDIFGSFASFLCALHCSVLPLFVGLGLISNDIWLESIFTELLLISVTFCVAGYSLLRAYFRCHGNLRIPLLAGMGIIVFAIGIQLPYSWNLLFSTIGGILIASAHIWNYRLSHA